MLVRGIREVTELGRNGRVALVPTLGPSASGAMLTYELRFQ
jgi:hypothetical protein